MYAKCNNCWSKVKVDPKTGKYKCTICEYEGKIKIKNKS